jgi:integrase
MYRFAVKKKLVAKNPFDDVQSIGRANKGKLQLRTDEAKRLTDYLTERASLGEWRALALLTQLFLGLRSSEVLKLKKRDLDCDASVIVVDGTKTKNAKRRLALDAPIVKELLRRRAASLKPEALLFSLDGSTVLAATVSAQGADEVLPASRAAGRLPALAARSALVACGTGRGKLELRGAGAGAWFRRSDQAPLHQRERARCGPQRSRL